MHREKKRKVISSVLFVAMSIFAIILLMYVLYIYSIE